LNATLKLLIVEGHDRVRAALAQRLHRTPGVRVLAAVRDVPAALSLIEERPLDLVLCDPHTLAGDRRRAIRTLAATGRPIVVWTSSLIEGEAAVLRAAGAAAVLLKDLDLTQLLHTVQALGEADTRQCIKGAAGPIYDEV
jgi:DNA-binding NarL/FixJ family response regulator